MSDTITTAMSTRTVDSRQSTLMPVGTRIQVVGISPEALHPYIGQIGTVVEHRAGTSPRVQMPTTLSNGTHWWVDTWRTLPAVGQRVTVTACLDAATEEFKNWATGREATYVSTGPDGDHLVRFDDRYGDVPNPATVFMVDFVLGAEVPVAEPLTSSEPVKSYADRERDARVTTETLIEAINDLAEREEWCGNFEEWCEENNVESRRRRDKEFSVTIDLTYEISSDDIISLFRRETRGDHDDVDADSVSVTSTVVVSVTTSEDSPYEMGHYDIESVLSDAGYGGFDDWSITSYEDSY